VGTVLGYHGMTIASLSVSGIPYWREGFPPLLEACKLVPYGDLAAMERAIDATTAAVILEPVQWASGCTVAPPGYLAGLRRLCDERGALLIVDEIQTGLGRTGKLLALDHWGVTPDILCLGKVLSGGVVPVSAAVYGPRVQQALLARPMFNNSTYGGNPLACAAAVATLEVLEAEGLVERARVLGQALEAGLARLIAAFPDILVEQRGLGLMRCLFTRDPRYGAMLAILLTSQHRVLLPCMIHAPYVIRFSPPFITSDAQLEQMLGAVEGALGRVREMGTAGIDRYFQEVNQKVSAPR
jgi:putrescine aminotransferase